MCNIYVVIPVYNAEKYLEETVCSVLGQPCAVAGIVLVNDGSTDASGAICDRLAQNNPKIHVLHQENAGVSAARNAGIEHWIASAADGYIAFLDSDDSWYPGFLKDTLSMRIAQNLCDIYAFGMVFCDEGAQHFSPPARYQQHVTAGGNEAIWSLQHHFAANLYKISLLRRWNIRFFQGYQYSEDKYFKMQCAFFSDKISFEPDILYVYRKNTAGAMAKSTQLCPMDYYMPIVNGWLKSDAFINGWKEHSGRECAAGRTLACVYLLDMASAHFMQWRPGIAVCEAVKNHPHYPTLLTLEEIHMTAESYKAKELFVKHPICFAWKYRVLGLLYYAARSFLRIPMIRRWRNQREFPYSRLP